MYNIYSFASICNYVIYMYLLEERRGEERKVGGEMEDT